MTIFAKRALLSTGWINNACVEIRDGKVAAITADTTPNALDIRVDTLLPAQANLHSHSFQRAMAGMTEFRQSGRESFWTWRDLMYQFLNHLTPDHIAAFAAQTFMEMQLAGYASVGEFHYVHHQQGGQPYDNLAELSDGIFAAAQQTGIGLTHLPVLYTYGGAGALPLSGGQNRFGNSIDRYQELVAICDRNIANLTSDCRVGIAPHSLRATMPDELSAILATRSSGPVHMHIAEQTKEIADIQSALGARPVEWLLNNASVDSSWCLIHATHMTDVETKLMAESGAVAGLCPITEANLGDGIFNGATFLEHGGKFGVGSDSNVNISLTEELRLLEYSQRLRDRERNVLAPEDGHTGDTLYVNAATGSASALGRASGEITIGKLADLMAIDSLDPTLCGLTETQLLDGFIFASKDSVVTDVWSAGRHQVRSGAHVQQQAIIATFRSAMQDLRSRLNASR